MIVPRTSGTTNAQVKQGTTIYPTKEYGEMGLISHTCIKAQTASRQGVVVVKHRRGKEQLPKCKAYSC